MLNFSLVFCGRLYRWQILRIIKRHVSREWGLRTRHLCKCLQHRRPFSVPPQSMVLWYTSLKFFKVALAHILSTSFNCKLHLFSNLSGILKLSQKCLIRGCVCMNALGADTYGCQPSCSDPDTGPCVSSNTCRCIRDIAYGSCDIRKSLTDSFFFSRVFMWGNACFIRVNVGSCNLKLM